MKHSLAALVVLLISLVLWFTQTQVQRGLAAEEYKRQTQISVSYTQYEWWMIRWSDNRVVCQIFTDHESVPINEEVLEYCHQELFDQWMSSSFCALAATEDNTTLCQGMYMFMVSSEPKQKAVIVDLPKAQAWITLTGCPAIPLVNRCAEIPSLLFSGKEPLPNEHITFIKGDIDGVPFACSAENCEVPLKQTSPQGSKVNFWTESSYGDRSDTYTAQVRVVESGFSGEDPQPGWYVDILSERWQGLEPISSCAQCWQAFPAIGESPLWLSDSDQPDALLSTNLYIYLAGQLILKGVVDASDCPSSGLLANGWANACGMGKAQPSVATWQNTFDQQIIEAAHSTGVPAILIKNIFAQESQFWPGALRDLEIQEYGLGHITEMGTDTVLLWNADFYNQFCPLVLSESTCEKGYIHLDPSEQAMLRGGLTMVADIDCPTCPSGIDLTQIGFSIKLFAQTLEASCVQIKQVIKNATGKEAAEVANYDDLWLFTLTNYHAGPGCLYDALKATWDKQKPLKWENVSNNFEPGCSTAITFVKNVTAPLQFKGSQYIINSPVVTETPQPNAGATESNPALMATEETPDPTPTEQSAP